MKVLVSDTIIKIHKDEGEKFKNESVFLYHLKNELQKMGHDVVKKLMWKDGHLVDDHQHYIRMRDWSWCVYNQHWAIYSLPEELERYGNIVLDKVFLT